MPELPACVLFDVGDVLISLRGWGEILPQEALAQVTPKLVDEFLTSDTMIGWETGRTDELEFFEATREFFSLDLDQEAFRALYLRRLGDAMAGMYDIVMSLKEMGARVAGLTDTSPLHLARLPSYPAVAELDPLLASCEIGRVKPDVETFEFAVERLGIPAGDVFFTDDREENVAGARRAGLRAEVFRGADVCRGQLGLER